MGMFQIGKPLTYNGVHKNQDTIDARVKCLMDDGDQDDPDTILPLDGLDVWVILSKRIEHFFKPELDEMVCAST